MSSKSYLFGLVSLGAVLIFAPLWIKARGETPAATYANRTLHVTIPYDAPRSGEGQLTMEVLDPEDGVLCRTERRVDVAAGNGQWQEDLTLGKALPVEDLIWDRLRYRFTYRGDGTGTMEGTESISEILSRPVLHILAQKSYLAGAVAAVRVVVTDPKNEPVAAGGTIRIELSKPDGAAQVLFKGRLNQRGTVEAQLRLPAGLTGQQTLRYIADTAIGTAEFLQTVRLEEKSSILLTTEKPIYQPGQTIHVRALALDRGTHQATANRKLIFELEDSRGNKVFRRETQSDSFGVASAEFTLAEEVNLGMYHLRALMGTTAELTLNVERYVLPRFKVALEFAGSDGMARHGYRPGEHVTGTIRANYFFGKPVQGEVSVHGSGMDVAMFTTAPPRERQMPTGHTASTSNCPSTLPGGP
jgi:hypothetical protein